VGGARDTYAKGDKSVQGFAGKAGRKETTRKTDALMVGWDQNTFYGHWLGSGFRWLRIRHDRGLL
jgi:hypothetical protein